MKNAIEIAFLLKLTSFLLKLTANEEFYLSWSTNEFSIESKKNVLISLFTLVARKLKIPFEYEIFL